MKLKRPPISAPGPSGFWTAHKNSMTTTVQGATEFVCQMHRFPLSTSLEDDANVAAVTSIPGFFDVSEDLLTNLEESGLTTMPGDTFANLRDTVARLREVMIKAGYTVEPTLEDDAGGN